jgi:hypothetical protein
MLNRLFQTSLVFSLLTTAGMLHASQWLCENEDGEEQVIDAQEKEPLSSLVSRAVTLWDKEPKAIIFYYDTSVDEQLNVWSWDAWKKQGDVLETPREYTHDLSAKELEDMQYFVTTIAYKPLDDVVLERRELENALERLDHIHPLRFIAACVEDLELRNAMHTIREDKWLWKNFFGKVKKTFNAEAKVGNMKPDYVKQFCAALDLEEETILSFVSEKKWDALADYLYAKYPRIS